MSPGIKCTYFWIEEQWNMKINSYTPHNMPSTSTLKSLISYVQCIQTKTFPVCCRMHEDFKTQEVIDHHIFFNFWPKPVI